MISEREPTTEEIAPKPDPSASFWSPWWILLFGVNVAALNWWRMGKRRKAILFLAIFVFYRVLREWFSINKAITDTDLDLMKAMLVILVLADTVFILLLVELNRRDIKDFKQQGQTPVSTRWTIIFKFFIVLAILLIVIEGGLYTLPKLYGYCSFPRFQDLVYQLEVTNRSGLDKLYLDRNDFGCGWVWFSESIFAQNIKGASPTYEYFLGGVYYDGTDEKNIVSISQEVYPLGRSITTREQFMQVLSSVDFWPPGIEGLQFDISNDSPLELKAAYCTDLVRYNERWCSIFLARESLLVSLSFRGRASAKYEQCIHRAVQKTAERLLQYDPSP